ncbi:BatD family protein [Algibacillus agarilyticus]|uniref:BatD family protein n=1 Tax=Algibacillus agarilyticus TaxID=2234133 RepID=UPI000DD0319A|nr:BatD family protein [Algibacillus agarilyticus]
MVSRLRNPIIFCLLTLISLTSHAATQVIASVDRNPIIANESVDLLVRVNEHVSNNALDTSALNKDFRVIGNSTSTETRIVNGQTTRITSFTVRLMPKKAGTLIIPALTINGAASTPINLQVQPQNTQQQQTQDIFVEASVSNNEVWLHQQIKYTVKLYLGLQLERGSLSQPELPGAIIEQVGKDRESEQLSNGRRFHVIERDYAITPQRSGEFTLASPVFNGEVVISGNRRSLFSRSQTKSISAIGDEVKLNVKPIPNNYPGHWLPSKMVQLYDEVTPQHGYVVGEPITRTITLTALDVAAELLPELSIQHGNDVKIYPAQAETHTKARGQDVIAQRIESMAIVPNQAGKVTLPAVTVTWWNTQFERIEKAELAAREITVAPAKVTQTTAVPSSLNPTVVQQDTSDNTTTTIEYQNEPWAWNNVSWLLSGLWLATLIGLLGLILNKPRAVKTIDKSQQHADNEKRAWSRLIKACKQSDRSEIQTQLPLWTSAFLQQAHISNLHLATDALNDKQLTDLLAQMHACQFSKQPSAWNADDLSQSLHRIRKDHWHNNKTAVLPTLNP